MDKIININKLDLTIRQRNIIFILFIIMLGSNLLLTIILLKNEELVLVMPSQFSRSFSISAESISANYLEDMSRDVVNVILNLTPEMLEYSSKTILRMVEPRSYGDIQKQLAIIAKDVKNNKIRTIFYPLQIEIIDGKTETYVKGQLYSFLGSKQISSNLKKYHVAFTYQSGKLSLTKFNEVEL